jgi:hypothetical protein
MKKEGGRPWVEWLKPYVVGSILSAVVIALVLAHQWYGLNRPDPAPPVRFAWELSYADFGQWLSGVAGALAFVWIVISYVKQSAALNDQANEMRRLREEADRRAQAEYHYRVLLERDVFLKMSTIIREEQLYCCQLLIERLRREKGSPLRVVGSAGNSLEKELPAPNQAAFGALEFLASLATEGIATNDDRRRWQELVFRNSANQGLRSEAGRFLDAQERLLELAEHVGLKPHLSQGPFSELSIMLRELGASSRAQSA